MTAHPPKPSVRDVLPLVLSYYSRPGNGAGGLLHIVLDDGNVDDDDVQYCYGRACEEEDHEAITLADLMLRMSKSQRLRLYRARKP